MPLCSAPHAEQTPATSNFEMNKKASIKSKQQRETNVAVLRPAIVRRFDRRITGQGEIEFPCTPTMLEPYMTKLAGLFTALGKPFSEEELAGLRKALETELNRGYEASPYSRLAVRFET